jgi:hypothetical protein
MPFPVMVATILHLLMAWQKQVYVNKQGKDHQ